MPVTLGTNIYALRTQRSLATSSEALSRVSERLSSGQRINRASDDAAGLAVASGLEAGKRIFGQALRNLNDGISALSIADQNIAQLVEIVVRQQELAEQASNGIFSDAQRSVIDREAQQLGEEYQRILEGASFNGIHLLDGSNAKLQLQAGSGINAVLAAQFLAQSTTTSSQLVGLGTFLNGNSTLNLNVSGSSPLTDAEMVAGDFNNDGFDDLLVFDDYNNAGWKATIELYYGSASGLTFQAQDTVNLVGGAFSNFQADIQGSSVAFTADGGTQFLVLGIDNPVFFGALGGAGVIGTAENFSISLGTFDFNGDGFNDNVIGDVGSVSVRLQDTQTQVVTVTDTESLAQAAFSLLTVGASRSALDSLGDLLDLLNDKRSRIGASQSRIGSAIEVLRTSTENYAAAEGRIRDADVAEESANLTRFTILQQTAASILAQATIQPQLALLLLQ